MNIYKELGLQRLVDDPAVLASLKQYVSDESSKVIPGYYYFYTLYTFSDRLEFEYCKTPDGEEAGFDIHLSGLNFCTFEFVDKLDDSCTAPVYLMKSGVSGEQFPVRVVCPDTRPPARPGSLFYGQIVGFAAAESLQEVHSSECSVIQHECPDTVLITGKIKSVAERTFDFEDVHADFYDLDVVTSIGVVSVLVSKNCKYTPPEGQMIQVICILSFDVAVKPETYGDGPYYENPYEDILPDPDDGKYYETGYIPTVEGDAQVVCDALERNDFRRIERICAKEVCIRSGSGESIADRAGVEEFLWMSIPAESPSFDLLHCVSSEDPGLLGMQGIEIREAGNVRRILLFRADNKGLIDNIQVCSPEHCQMGVDYELHALAQMKEVSCDSRIELLENLLAKNCTYKSDYSGRTLVGNKNIIRFLDEVQGNLDETNQYTGEILPASDVLRDCTARPIAYSGNWTLVEHQSGELAYAMFICLNSEHRISNILLSRDGRYINLFDVDEVLDNDPSKGAKAILTGFYGKEDPVRELRANPAPEDDDLKDVFIWKKADDYARSWLSDNEYDYEETVVEDDCLVYHCSYREEKWTLYLFAYGEKKRVLLDTDFCVQLKNRESAEDRKVMIIGLQVVRETDDNGKLQCTYRGYGRKDPESWILFTLKGRDIVLYYPRRDVYEMIPRLMAAVNMRDRDVLEALLAKGGYLKDWDGGCYMNNAYYTSLVNRVIQHGKMRVAYVSYDGTVYSKIPYIEDYCYLSFSVNDEHKVDHITEKALDCSYTDLVITDEVPMHDPRNDTPRLVAVEAFAPSEFSRLSLRLTYENNDIRRYDFKGDFGKDEVFSVEGYTFTDKMFSCPRLTEHHELNDTMGESFFVERGQGVEFINGYSISAVPMYFDSYPIEQFSYANMKDENVCVSQFDYDEDGFGVGHIYNLDPRNPLYLLDRNTLTAKTLPEEYWESPIFIEPFCGGYSEGRVMVSKLPKLELQYHHKFSGCAGMWGWLDRDLNVVIPPQYIYAMNFVDGQAIVCKGEWDVKEANGQKSYWCEHEAWGVIDRDGGEIIPCAYDELYDIEGTSRYFFVHEGGWENGHNAVYDTEVRRAILELDFEFDRGYMFNECFVTDRNILVFIEHQPGEGLDYMYAYDLNDGKCLAYKQEYRERKYNGQSRVVVKKDGKDIIVF